MFGAIAALSAATPASANIIHEFVEQLGAEENFIAGAALALLTGAVLAITVPTISSAFSASLCAIRYDILPIFLDKPILGRMGPVGETRIRKFASIAGGGLCLVVLGTFYVVDRYRPMAIYANEFPALVFALYCAQLSFVPLVLGPVIGRARAELSPGWALSVIGCSALVALGSVAVYVASRNELWLWGAVPASLGCSLLVFIVASIRPKTMHNSTNRTR
jgi:hypothetical protein